MPCASSHDSSSLAGRASVLARPRGLAADQKLRFVQKYNPVVCGSQAHCFAKLASQTKPYSQYDATLPFHAGGSYSNTICSFDFRFGHACSPVCAVCACSSRKKSCTGHCKRDVPYST